MLNEGQILSGKQRFMDIVNTLPELTDSSRLFRFDDLLNLLETSDWFTAPASAKYHHCWAGGLCQHSLEVYDNMVMLNDQKNLGIDPASLIICGLFHDMAKVNYYEPTSFNKKIDGKWVAIPGYKVTDHPIPYGNHEQTCAWLLRQFIGLTFDEEAAILNHHFGLSYDSTKIPINGVFDNNNLATILHIADMMSTYIDNKKDKNLND